MECAIFNPPLPVLTIFEIQPISEMYEAHLISCGVRRTYSRSRTKISFSPEGQDDWQ